MNQKNPRKICLVPKLEGLGGTASFQARLMEGLARRSMGVTFDLHDESAGVILVVGGTRHFNDLIAAKKRGAMIVQRLDGINWIHRRIYTGIRHFLKAEINNRTIAHIRRNLADRIVYQSHFVKDWWAKRYGDQDTPSYVIHNGVDLTIYNPKGPGGLPKGLYRLLLVEGRLGGGLHMGLENAVDLTRRLQNHHHLPVSLRVVGEVPERLKMKVDLSAGIPIEWRGVVERSRIPELDRSAHLLFSGDINAACPNAVIEALACGLPVVAFNTGALKELVTDQIGKVTPYGGDVWQLDKPDISRLADASVDVLKNNSRYRRAARAHAEQHFSLEQMVDSYCKVWDSI